MNFIGDYFALGLVAVLCMFFFDGKHTLNKTSRIYVACLIGNAANAVVDIATGELLEASGTPLWMNMTVNSLYFAVNIFTTSCITLYLFNRILEHSHSQYCMRYAVTGLVILDSAYLIFLVLNFFNGWLFYFDEQNLYCRGPLNSIGYIVTVLQMILVVICYLRNRKKANSSMRRVIVQTFPVIVLSILIQRKHPEIMLNSFIMSMVMTILFLTFMGQRPGVHVLTRLNDRHSFMNSLRAHMHNGHPCHIFMINIKNFGVLNQKYGHIFGDELLYQFAFSLEKLIDQSEAFHMNGTVFALIIPDITKHNGEKYRETVLGLLQRDVQCGKSGIVLDCVAAEYPADMENRSVEQIYEVLEYAAAKAYRERIRHIVCTKALVDEMLRRRYLIERMRHVDKEHGFYVWYHPILCVDTGRYCSMEALVRMKEPDGSVVSPAEFIPIAEQTGMLGPITWFVLEETCKLLRDHRELDHTSVSINMPMVQMIESGFAERMNSVVNRYGITHDRIGIEFTERAILENFKQLQSVMANCLKLGYRFYLDDFGAGYSNFNCLLRLPFRIIKLDMDLIRMDIAPDGSQSFGLIRTLTQYLHEMNLTIVAEGVETQGMADTLIKLGIDRIQGYVYAMPMPEDALIEFYKNH